MEQSIGVSGLVSFILRFWGSKMYKIIVLGEKSLGAFLSNSSSVI